MAQQHLAANALGAVTVAKITNPKSAKHKGLIMKKLLYSLCVLALAATTTATSAQTTNTLTEASVLQQPSFNSNDSWTYKISEERGQSAKLEVTSITVNRATSSSVFYNVKSVSSPNLPASDRIRNVDWSSTEVINGKPIITNRPLAFPLTIGKTWDVEYVKLNPAPNRKSEKIIFHHKVTGIETIQVAAGTFKALKVEAEGSWQAELNASQSVSVNSQASTSGIIANTQIKSTVAEATEGQFYKVFWYVPEVKRWVKSIEESYSSANVLSYRQTSELEKYTLPQN